MSVNLRADSPANLVACLPYLFGFTPSQSVMVLGLKGTRIDVAARIDASVVLAPDFDQDALRHRLACVTGNPTMVVVVWMDDEAQARRALDLTVTCLGGVDLGLLVCGGRCFDGDTWADVPGQIPAAEQAGMTVLSSRDVLAQKVAGPTGDAVEQATTAWRTASAAGDRGAIEMADWAWTLIRDWLDFDPSRITPEFAAQLAFCVQSGAVRDTVEARMTMSNARQYLALWLGVVNQVPDDAAPAVLGLAGLAAWLAGDGALEVCAIERGLTLDPDHPLLRLVEQINVQGVRPDLWEKITAAQAREHDDPGDPWDIATHEDTLTESLNPVQP